MNADNREIISELHEISELISRSKSCDGGIYLLRFKRDNELTQEIEHCNEEIETYRLEKMNLFNAEKPENIFKAIAPPPKKPVLKDVSGGDIVKAVIIGFSAAISIIVWLIFVAMGEIEEGGMLIGLLFALPLIFGGIWIFKSRVVIEQVSRWQREYSDYKKEKNKWIKSLDKDVLSVKQSLDKRHAEYIEQFKAYELEFKKLVTDCENNQKNSMSKCSQNRSAINARYAEEIMAETEKKAEIKTELATHNLISPELYELVDEIAKNLELGRADTLKEAINIALNDKRHEEEEEARRLEADNQRRILEAQAEENRRHNYEMASNAEKAAREQRSALNKMAREQEKAARAAESARINRCYNCINHNKCSYSVKQQANCGAYVPRR